MKNTLFFNTIKLIIKLYININYVSIKLVNLVFIQFLFIFLFKVLFIKVLLFSHFNLIVLVIEDKICKIETTSLRSLLLMYISYYLTSNSVLAVLNPFYVIQVICLKDYLSFFCNYCFQLELNLKNYLLTGYAKINPSLNSYLFMIFGDMFLLRQ